MSELDQFRYFHLNQRDNGAQGRNRTTDTRIFRGIGNLYFFIFQQLMGRPLPWFAQQCMTMHNQYPQNSGNYNDCGCR